MLKPMMSANQIAEYLGLHPATIRAWYTKNLIPKPDIRKHRLVRWKAETIEEFLKDPIAWQEKEAAKQSASDAQA